MGDVSGGRISKTRFQTGPVFFANMISSSSNKQIVSTTNYLRRMQNFEKTGQKRRYWTILTKKIAFFGARSPSK